ncbi:unnamed protein product, partial [Thlaspi arvense]
MNLNQCAVCKAMKVQCSTACVFAPHFPSTEPEKFDRVNRVFGVQNVYRVLGRLPRSLREDAVDALCYEAEARIRDPIHGYIFMNVLVVRRDPQHRDEPNEIKPERFFENSPDFKGLGEGFVRPLTWP